MLYRTIIALLLISLFTTSCQDEVEDSVCYSFDLKSCRGDAWLDGLDTFTAENISKETIDYLSTKGIGVRRVTVDMAFHEVVCLACEVCPSGQRVFLSIDSGAEALLTREDLLSLSRTDCSSLNQ